MGRWVVRGVNVAIFVLCCFLVASIVNRISAEALAVPPSVAPRSAQALPAPSRDWQERRVIVDRNLFGASLDSGEPLEEPEEELVKTKLPLRLLGTAASPDARLSTAAVEDQSTRKHDVVRVGDKLEAHPQVEVVRIEPRRIVLQNGARREELALEEDFSQTASASPRRSPPPRSTPRVSTRSRLQERLRQLSENRFAVTEEGAEELGRNPASLVQDCRPIPERGPDGQILGYRLSNVRGGGICEQAGIQTGEVITEVNGIAIDSPTALSQLLAELASADEWNVVVQSADGAERPVTITRE